MAAMSTTLITGASRGIGRALAIACRRRGDVVVAIARSCEDLARLGEALGEPTPVWEAIREAPWPRDATASSTTFLPIVCDTSDPVAVQRVSNELRERALSPDLLLLGAGTGDLEDERSLDVERHRATFATNYFGVLHWVEAFHDPDAARTFVAISSIAGWRGLPGAPAYGASKAALTHTFESLACSAAATRQRFVLVHPGPVDTAMLKTDGPVPFTITPEDAARRILSGLDRERPQIDFAGPWPLFARIVRWLPVRVHRHVFGTLRARKRARSAPANRP